LNLPDKVGRAFYYILIAAAAIGILNLPIQVVQLVMLGKLTFPTVSLPFAIPWYVLIIGVIGIMVLFMLAFGFLWAKLKVADHMNNVSNENNPQMRDIIERLERIESQVTRAENDWR
jgi:TRAP-type C4-dicarboxylate transport system permease small subunit